MKLALWFVRYRHFEQAVLSIALIMGGTPLYRFSVSPSIFIALAMADFGYQLSYCNNVILCAVIAPSRLRANYRCSLHIAADKHQRIVQHLDKCAVKPLLLQVFYYLLKY